MRPYRATGKLGAKRETVADVNRDKGYGDDPIDDDPGDRPPVASIRSVAQQETVTDPVNVDAMQREAAAYRQAHPRIPVGPSPLPAFQTQQMKLRILAEAVLARHREAEAMRAK